MVGFKYPHGVDDLIIRDTISKWMPMAMKYGLLMLKFRMVVQGVPKSHSIGFQY